MAPLCPPDTRVLNPKRGKEARAQTCGSQLGMLLPCARRAQPEIFKDAAFRRGRVPKARRVRREL